jgi:ABC-type multidrug transport system ATPase subunit
VSQTPTSLPVLRIRADGRELIGLGNQELVIGRDLDVAIRVDHQLVSRRHAVLRPEPAGWVLMDLGSRNGTFERGRRLDALRIDGVVHVRLGHPSQGPVLELVPAAGDKGAPGERRRPAAPVAPAAWLETRPDPPGRPPEHLDPTFRWELGTPDAAYPLGPAALRIGRAPSNDVTLDDLSVSRHHAAVRGDPSTGFRLLDLGSHNGTFLNGRRLGAEAPLRDFDLIGIGRTTFRLVGTVLEAFEAAEGERLEVVGCRVTAPDGRNLVDAVSFALEGANLLALVGPTGAGKSTLLKALAGTRPADAGTVWYGGRDLYAEYDELRLRLGYVPQDDILHPQLTVMRALAFAAELRFPPDVGRADRAARVVEVLDELGLAERADQVISTLSGGQRKRVNVAMELLTRPSLLLLDEPTSGLDPGYERAVMAQLRALADGGRTVVVVTHSLDSLELCDRVLFLAPGGRTAFFGPPAEALAWFEADDFAEVFVALDRDRRAVSAARFAASPGFERWVTGPLAERDQPGRRARGSGGPELVRVPRLNEGRERASPGPPPRRNRLRQLATLTRRYLAVLAADRRNLLVLTLQAPVLGLLMLRVMGADGLAPGGSLGNTNARKVLLALVLTATWLGASNAVREIVKELPVYRRERSIGLSASAYLASKVLVLAVLTVTQAAVFTLIAGARAGGPAQALVLGWPRLELIAGVAAAGLAAMAFGLAVSALVDNADKALSLLPLLLVPQLVLSGALFDLGGQPELGAASWLASARWGYSAVAATADLRSLEPLRCDPGDPAAGMTVGCEEPWAHEPGTWGADLLALGVLALVCLAAARIALRRFDPRAPRGRRPVPRAAGRAP